MTDIADAILTDVKIGDKKDQNVLIHDGKIAQISATRAELGEHPDAQILPGEHRVLIPGIVEPHMHLDKALLSDRMPNPEGTLAGAIKVTGILKSKFTMEDVLERSRKVLDMAIAHGTTLIRSHPDVDMIEHSIGAEAMLTLRDEYRGRLDLQVVAFPQEGIIKSPGVYELMDKAMSMGADVVGGCTYNEPTLEECKKHVNMVFDLAEKYDAPIDMHCDFMTDDTDPRYGLAEYIADVTIQRGWQGRVTLGHVTSLGSLSGGHRTEVFDKLKEARINIVCLPFTDMHLNAREDDSNVRRGIAPITRMWDAGLNVGISSNNVRNGFTPFGNADLMDVALFAAQTGHMGSPEEFQHLMDTITYTNAQIVGIGDGYGLEVGDRADLVVLDAPDEVNALLDRAVRTYVLKGGKLVASTTTTTTLSH